MTTALALVFLPLQSFGTILSIQQANLLNPRVGSEIVEVYVKVLDNSSKKISIQAVHSTQYTVHTDN
ncbi:hypothetical protein [Brasilonema sp. UFV-L1]|uniref:hypothetical protein n=1 Tax=Brasilonema sp. UFV-L1 TaxID=2234130 RepID=UPI00145DA048|nr:hypothetical protein [Brasilonema sp. UFV-L1]NMG09989.1 hypothetical protein [Brasilonema sp. UFV-L1]